MSAAPDGNGKTKFHRHVAVRFSGELVSRATPSERLEHLAEIRVKLITVIRERVRDHYDPTKSQHGASFLVDIGITDLA